MTALSNNTEDFLSHLAFFRGLSVDDIHDFVASATIQTYAKNDTILIHGDSAGRFFVILSGWVKLHRTTPQGDEAVIALFQRGDVFGEAAMFRDSVYPFSVQAVEESQIIEIPASILRYKIKDNPELMTHVMSSMSHKLVLLQLENEHMALMSAAQRVGCLLLQLSAGMVGQGGRYTFPYDKSLAAARLGMTAETFSRALKQLKAQGVTVKGTEVSIENFIILGKFCCEHCSASAGECALAEHCHSSGVCMQHMRKFI